MARHKKKQVGVIPNTKRSFRPKLCTKLVKQGANSMKYQSLVHMRMIFTWVPRNGLFFEIGIIKYNLKAPDIVKIIQFLVRHVKMRRTLEKRSIAMPKLCKKKNSICDTLTDKDILDLTEKMQYFLTINDQVPKPKVVITEINEDVSGENTAL